VKTELRLPAVVVPKLLEALPQTGNTAAFGTAAFGLLSLVAFGVLLHPVSCTRM
jgi:LPXTG-motif cell wall-anchored protein